jgi:hypothetical protein
VIATVRVYTGVSDAAIAAVTDRSADIGTLLCGVPGSVGCQLIRTRDGLVVVIIGDDEAALVEAGRRFVAWTRRYVPTFRSKAIPTVWAGEVLLSTLNLRERG